MRGKLVSYKHRGKTPEFKTIQFLTRVKINFGRETNVLNNYLSLFFIGFQRVLLPVIEKVVCHICLTCHVQFSLKSLILVTQRFSCRDVAFRDIGESLVTVQLFVTNNVFPRCVAHFPRNLGINLVSHGVGRVNLENGSRVDRIVL